MDTRVTRNVVADPRTSLAMWLRAGRAQRKLTLDDVARVTKIQPRILEKIEAGNLEGLPAEVFVRGFVKSFARCVGLDEPEAVERYGQCANASALPTTSVARAVVETLVAAPKNATPTAPTMREAPPEILPSASMELTPIAEHPDLAAAPEIEIVVAPVETEIVAAPAAAPAHAIEVIEIGAAQPEQPASSEAPATLEVAQVEAATAAAAPEALAPEPELSAADQFFAPSDGLVVEQDVVETTAAGPVEG